MDTRKPQESLWHHGILQQEEACYQELLNAYQQPLLDHILDGFGNYLRHDLTLANEAVWLAFQYYLQYPHCYQPSKGSLYCYLQIHAERNIQKLLHQENRNWHFQHLDYILARYFDNELDIRLAKLVLKGEKSWLVFANLLDTGELPIAMQLKEISRNIARISQKLLKANIDFTAMANRRKKINKKRELTLVIGN